MRRVLALVAVLVAGTAAAGSAAPRTDPLVGTWRYGDGLVRVERGGDGAYTGTVVRSIRFLACAHLAGERMWRLFGEEGHYSGTQLSFGPRAGCGLRVRVPVSLRIEERTLAVRASRREFVRPGACGAGTDCFRLERVGSLTPPLPPGPTAATPPPTRGLDVAARGRPSGAASLGPGFVGTEAAGRVTLSGGSASGSLTFVQTFEDRSELLVLEVTGLVSATAARLQLEVTVKRSDSADCDAASRGRLVVVDSVGGDRVRVQLCGWDLIYAAGAFVGAARPG